MQNDRRQSKLHPIPLQLSASIPTTLPSHIPAYILHFIHLLHTHPSYPQTHLIFYHLKPKTLYFITNTTWPPFSAIQTSSASIYTNHQQAFTHPTTAQTILHLLTLCNSDQLPLTCHQPAHPTKFPFHLPALPIPFPTALKTFTFIYSLPLHHFINICSLAETAWNCPCLKLPHFINISPWILTPTHHISYSISSQSILQYTSSQPTTNSSSQLLSSTSPTTPTLPHTLLPLNTATYPTNFNSPTQFQSPSSSTWIQSPAYLQLVTVCLLFHLQSLHHCLVPSPSKKREKKTSPQAKSPDITNLLEQRQLTALSPCQLIPFEMDLWITAINPQHKPHSPFSYKTCGIFIWADKTQNHKIPEIKTNVFYSSRISKPGVAAGYTVGWGVC